jgi:hypothetical protein
MQTIKADNDNDISSTTIDSNHIPTTFDMQTIHINSKITQNYNDSNDVSLAIDNDNDNLSILPNNKMNQHYNDSNNDDTLSLNFNPKTLGCTEISGNKISEEIPHLAKKKMRKEKSSPLQKQGDTSIIINNTFDVVENIRKSKRALKKIYDDVYVYNIDTNINQTDIESVEVEYKFNKAIQDIQGHLPFIMETLHESEISLMNTVHKYTILLR